MGVSHLDLINWTNRLKWFFWELSGNKRKWVVKGLNDIDTCLTHQQLQCDCLLSRYCRYVRISLQFETIATWVGVTSGHFKRKG